MQDVEWEAVFQLLHYLRGTLQCRTLTLSAMPDLSPLPPLLSSLISTTRLALFGNRLSVADVGASVFPLLALLATYPSHLDRRAQVSDATEGEREKDVSVCSMTWCAVWKEVWWASRQLSVCRLLQCVVLNFSQP